MTTIALKAQAPRHQGIVTRIVQGLAASFTARREAAELQMLEALPPHLLNDIGLPGFHLMTSKTRKAAYRAAISGNA